MGFIVDRPAASEVYSIEARRESFYFSGEHTFGTLPDGSDGYSYRRRAFTLTIDDSVTFSFPACDIDCVLAALRALHDYRVSVREVDDQLPDPDGGFFAAARQRPARRGPAGPTAGVPAGRGHGSRHAGDPLVFERDGRVHVRVRNGRPVDPTPARCAFAYPPPGHDQGTVEITYTLFDDLWRTLTFYREQANTDA